MNRSLYRMALIAVAALAVAACSDNDERVVVPPDNTVVVDEEIQNDINECPRADGQPCR